VQELVDDRPELARIIEPLLSTRALLLASLQRLDDCVQEKADQSSICRLLMTVPGVGPVTALAFAATVDDPTGSLVRALLVPTLV
jgi:transposase